MAWLLLGGAVIAEIFATLTMRSIAETFRILPLIGVIGGYLIAFTLMTFALRTLNVGVVYAIWSGIGTAGVAALAAVLFKETLNLTAIGGIALIIVGVVVLAASGSVSHD